MSRAVLASMLVALTSPAFAEKQQAQKPAAVSVTCEVFEIWASHGPAAMDPGIPKQLATRLTNELKQTTFKLLSKSLSKKLEKKKPETIKLAKGSTKLELVEIVDKTQIRLNVRFDAAKGKAEASSTFAAADWIVVVAKTTKDANTDAHVLAVSCK